MTSFPGYKRTKLKRDVVKIPMENVKPKIAEKSSARYKLPFERYMVIDMTLSACIDLHRSKSRSPVKPHYANQPGIFYYLTMQY